MYHNRPSKSHQLPFDQGVQIVIAPRSPTSVPEPIGTPSDGIFYRSKWPGFVVYYVPFFVSEKKSCPSFSYIHLYSLQICISMHIKKRDFNALILVIKWYFFVCCYNLDYLPHLPFFYEMTEFFFSCIIVHSSVYQVPRYNFINQDYFFILVIKLLICVCLNYP